MTRTGRQLKNVPIPASDRIGIFGARPQGHGPLLISGLIDLITTSASRRP